MNARKTLALSLVVVLTAVSAAAAAPGTNKSRGIYNRGGWESTGAVRSRSSYSYRASATYSAPVVQSTPSPMVAQAPEEGRRFSYAPSDSAVTGSPCSPVQAPATASTVDSGRRYSYAPAVESTALAASAPRTYYSRPSYSGSGRSGGSVDRWALPKTDPRKYNSR